MTIYSEHKNSYLSHVYSLVVLSLFILPLISCSKDEEPNTPSTSINKIMALGASRVEGNRPNYESYRYELWKLLIDDNWTFDFIGTQSDPANYPSVNGNNFDMDHEGRGGWTSGQILNGIENWLEETGAPDIVLFSSPGGNDLLQNLSLEEAVSNVNAIIDALQADNPNVIIIIEQLAPGRSDLMTPALIAAFNQMQDEVNTIATNESTTSSKIITVDMVTGFNDTFLADAVHYNEAGAAFIANRYYDVLENVLEQ